jgi:hypothetical protein
MATNTTTNGQCYLLDIDGQAGADNSLEFQFIPKEFDWQRNADIETLKIIGQNLPDFQYTGGQTTLNLQLDFYAQDEDRKDVLRRARWLESLTFSEGQSAPPHRVKLVFGDFFRDTDIWHVKSTRIKYSNFHKQYGFLPQQAYIDIVFGLEPSSISAQNASDIRAGAEQTGLSTRIPNITNNAASGIENTQQNKDASRNFNNATGTGVENLTQNQQAKFALQRSKLSRVLGATEGAVQYGKLGFTLVKNNITLEDALKKIQSSGKVLFNNNKIL